MLTKNGIFDLLEIYFKKMGNTIRKSTTSLKGSDLILEDSLGNKTYIEANGETSLNINSKRRN
ncbi:MAG: hypothetical protein K0S24_1992 [Sphingobacterium sp.]|jgi:hypothetical protein|nr:hypothetical protein [Sphingobacterium sp.]